MVFDFNIHKKTPIFRKKSEQNEILNARALLRLGDSITTDHISPAGVIKRVVRQEIILQRDRYLKMILTPMGLEGVTMK